MWDKRCLKKAYIHSMYKPINGGFSYHQNPSEYQWSTLFDQPKKKN